MDPEILLAAEYGAIGAGLTLAGGVATKLIPAFLEFVGLRNSQTLTRLGAVEVIATQQEKKILELTDSLLGALSNKNVLEMALARQDNDFKIQLAWQKAGFDIQVAELKRGQDDCMAKHAATQAQLDAVNLLIAAITKERDALRVLRTDRDMQQTAETAALQAQVTDLGAQNIAQNADRAAIQAQVTALNDHRDSDGNLTNLSAP